MLEPDKEKEEIPKGFIPKVITGGKGPPKNDEFDWISSLPIRTTILIQSKRDQNFPLAQLTIFHKFQKALMVFVPDQSPKPIPIDPIRFCSQYRLYEIIQTAEEYESERELDNQIRSQDGDSRSIQSE